MKEFLKNKAFGWYFSAFALVMAIVTLIVYTVRGGNAYSSVESLVVAMLLIGIVLNVVVLVKDFKVGAFLPLIFYTITLGVLLNTEMLFISNVLTAIDNNAFDPAFIVFLATLTLAILASCVAAVKKISK